MSRFSQLINTAKGYFRKSAKPATDCVHQDTFDKMFFKESVEEAPALANLIAETNYEYDHTEDLIRDVFSVFFKAYPELRSVEEMDSTRLVNHAVVSDVMEAPDMEQLRTLSSNDRYSSVIATISVAEQIKSKLKAAHEKQQECEQEQQEKQRALEWMQEQLKSIAEGAEELLEDMAGVEGPLTEEQAQAAQALEDAIAQAGQAQQAAQDALGLAQETAEGFGQEVRQVIRESVSQSQEKLSHEMSVMLSWGMELGDIQRMPFQERMDLARLLTTGKLGKFYKQLGRFKFQASADRARKVEYVRDEFVGTRLSGDLPDVLSSELVMSKHRTLRLDFLQRLAEGQLLSKHYEGVERIGKGPIIVCVDNSSSMAGQREIWAKSLAIALIDQARAADRECVTINFSYYKSDMKVYRFPKGKANLPVLIDFVTNFINGGTDFQHPIDEAVRIMLAEFNDSGKGKADLIFITDDECDVSEQWLEAYLENKKLLGFRTYGIAIGVTRPGSTLKSLSDNVRGVTDFIDTSQMSDLFRSV